MRHFRQIFSVIVAAGLLLAASLTVSAMDPKPGNFIFRTDSTGHVIRGNHPQGYRSPALFYVPSETFSYSFRLTNTGVPPAFTDHSTATDCFDFAIFKLGALSAFDTFTEAELEAKVHNGQAGVQTLVFGPRQHTIALPNAVAVAVTESAALAGLGTGYFQFDFGFCEENLGPGGPVPLNSGFIRILGPAAGTLSINKTCATGVTGSATFDLTIRLTKKLTATVPCNTTAVVIPTAFISANLLVEGDRVDIHETTAPTGGTAAANVSTALFGGAPRTVTINNVAASGSGTLPAGGTRPTTSSSGAVATTSSSGAVALATTGAGAGPNPSPSLPVLALWLLLVGALGWGLIFRRVS